jgi:hypothetical protein
MDLKGVRIPTARFREVGPDGRAALIGWTVVGGLIVYRNGQRVGVLQELTREDGYVTISVMATDAAVP